jgi:UDP-N-acetylmuramoylalanine--D-glutamate ligase
MTRAVVVGFGTTGRAVARLLLEEGFEVVVFDDDPAADRQAAAALGVELVVAPEPGVVRRAAARAGLVVASPGVPPRHEVFEAGVEVLDELDLGFERCPVPIAAVTGTNGKTTVVTLAARMLEASGIRVALGGNVGTPFVALAWRDAQVVVLEVSSFQLARARSFRARVGEWLNFSPNHLDWHPDLEDYRRAKARLFWRATPDSTVVANAEDPVVLGEALRAASRGVRLVTFGGRDGAWRMLGSGDEAALVGPEGELLARVGDLPRRAPHDLQDALGAAVLAAEAAAAVGAQADLAACRAVLEHFEGLPHRMQLVATAGGVRFVDDSKATTPRAVLAALEGLESVVLIAGGRDKGLDLETLARAAPRLRAVVGIGEASPRLAKVFDGLVAFSEARSMTEAVRRAAALAKPGDTVLLSPACASFDWFRSYEARGDAFRRAVEELIGARPEARVGAQLGGAAS